jgi:EmrB/QacA subfamily drug resistance transporter
MTELVAPAPRSVATPRRRAFAVVAVGTFMAQLDLFIVNIAFPAIAQDFAGSSERSLSWVLSAYAIVFAACLVPAGRLGDLLGRRRTFEIGLAVFALGSAGCAAAPGVGVLVAARAVQAVGAALVVPTSLGLLLSVFTGESRAGAVGAWASMGAVAAACGPSLGGLLVEASWRWIFLINLPLALGALAAAPRVLDEVRHPESGRLPDLLGIALLVAGIGGLVLCIVRTAPWEWLLGPAFALALFLWRCARHPAPVVELSLLALRPFAVANGVMLLFYVGFGAMLLCNVLFLTGVWGYGTVEAGLMIAPGPLIVALLSFNVNRLLPRFGARAVVVAGCLCFAAGSAWWRLRLGPEPAYLTRQLPGMVAAATGVALTQASIFSFATGLLPPSRLATGSGVLNMSRQIGLALGVAVLVALGDFHARYEEMVLAGLAAALVASLLPTRTAAAAR